MNATTAAPAVFRSRSCSIGVEPMTCTTGALRSDLGNRCTQHHVVQDFWPTVRNFERAGIIGDKPC